jgi:hypothetical protein
MVNLPEINRVLAHCEAHPKRHDQGMWLYIPESGWTEDEETLITDWQCHTTACLAGWTAILNGWKPEHIDSVLVCNPATGEIDSVPTVARKILGLTVEQAQVLFTRTTTVADIRACVDRFLAEESAES